ncbi:MAG: hypothetical protein PHR35_16965 [Kiritimatiellae bacterium]|nr:hypothetical protein [Kiritimatiellia bacterium]
MSRGIEGQERANYWKDVQATVTTQGVGGSCFRIDGTNVLGSPVTQTVTVTADAVRCQYRADWPFVLRGQFPGEPEANWFKSESSAGQEVQGELWGEYTDLALHRVLEYTYGGRCLRLAFGAECPLRLTPCETVHVPARFSLASHPTGNRGSMLDFAVILSRCTSVYICHCWVDGNVPQEHDEQLREFTSAYRSIPLGKYKTGFAGDYPGITVRGSVQKGNTYFYAVNTPAEPRTVRVVVEGKLKERTAGYPALVREGKACS